MVGRMCAVLLVEAAEGGVPLSVDAVALAEESPSDYQSGDEPSTQRAETNLISGDDLGRRWSYSIDGIMAKVENFVLFS